MLNYRDHDAALPLVRAAHEAFGFTRVVSLVDQAMELVGRINDEFGLYGTSREVAHRFDDKARHARVAALDRLRGRRRRAGRTTRPDSRGSARGTATRIVLKPADGTAGRGVSASRPRRARAGLGDGPALRDREDLPFASYYPVREFVAEEYLDGVEYGVEAFSFDGRHSIVAITGKSLEGVIEMGHAQPAVSRPRTRRPSSRTSPGSWTRWACATE